MIVLVGAALAAGPMTGEAEADPLGWELQPVPGWTCASEPTDPPYHDDRCTAGVDAGDVALTCAQWDSWNGDTVEGTGCTATQAGEPVAGCSDEYIQPWGSPSAGSRWTTRGCFVGENGVGCVQHYEFVYSSSTDRTTCTVAAGDASAGCVQTSTTAPAYAGGQGLEAGCSAGDGVTRTTCAVRVDDVTGKPVVTPSCPATEPAG